MKKDFLFTAILVMLNNYNRVVIIITLPLHYLYADKTQEQ